MSITLFPHAPITAKGSYRSLARWSRDAILPAMRQAPPGIRCAWDRNVCLDEEAGLYDSRTVLSGVVMNAPRPMRCQRLRLGTHTILCHEHDCRADQECTPLTT